MPISRSFSTRIALAFGALALVVVVLAEVVWYAGIPALDLQGARANRLAEATQMLTLSANQRYSSIRNSIAERRGDVLVLAEDKALSDKLGRGDRQALQKTTEQIFERWARAYPNAFVVLRVLDPIHGAVLASSQSGEIGKALGQPMLLQRALQPGVSELVEEVPGRAGVELAILRPVFAIDDDGYPEGVARGFLMVSLASEGVLMAGIGNNRASDEQPGVTLVLGSGNRQLARFPVGQESDKAFWRMGPQANGFEGAMQVADGAGANYLAIYRHIPLSGNQSLTLIHYQAVEEALADLQGQLRGAVWAGLLIALTVLLLIYFFSRRLTIPLRRLTLAARRLGGGEMSARMRADPHDSLEIFDLSTGFNSMADSLEGHQHSLEQQLADQKRELAVRAELESSLIAARDAAESANRAKSTFLANMSHELRTPLNAVLGFSNLLQREPGLTDVSRKKLTTINRAGQHLLTLINDVLEISRIEAGYSVATVDNFDLEEVLNDAEAMMRVRADAKGLRFTVEHAADLNRFVQGDAPHLKQVLINLMGNAVKYTEQGSVHVSVKRRNGDVEFAITDTGPGISAADQLRLFQPFFQTEAGIAKGEGTGLGLAISQEYTRLMGGRLEVQSQPGHGSSFILSMPLPPCNAPLPQSAAVGPVIALESGQGTVRVLVVDDKADNRELLRLLLEHVGFEVDTAEDGLQAVQAFKNRAPHFIWMDMRMPVMDGYEATRQIRALAGGSAVKIAALTANAFEEDRAKILEAGCDDLVRKPIEEERLFAVMGAQLGLRYRYEQTVAPSQPAMVAPDLSVLPGDMLQSLKAAAQALDMEAMQQLVDAIRVTHPSVAGELNTLVQGFRLDTIAELVSP